MASEPGFALVALVDLRRVVQMLLGNVQDQVCLRVTISLGRLIAYITSFRQFRFSIPIQSGVFLQQPGICTFPNEALRIYEDHFLKIRHSPQLFLGLSKRF